MDRHEFQLRFDTHKLVISIKIATKATPTTAIHIWLSMCCAHLWQYWHHKGDNYRVNMQTTRCNAIDIGFRVCVHVNNRVIMKDLRSVLWYDTFIILLLFLFFLHLFCALYVNSFCPRYFYVSIWRIISLAKKSEFINLFCCCEFHNVSFESIHQSINQLKMLKWGIIQKMSRNEFFSFLYKQKIKLSKTFTFIVADWFGWCL